MRRIFERRDDFEKTFLFSIARNLALKDHRDGRREEPLDDDMPAAAQDEALRVTLSSAVENAVASLPSLQQEAVILFEYEGFTLEEIARLTSVDVGTIKSRLHRAREHLKTALAPYRSSGVAYDRR